MIVPSLTGLKPSSGTQKIDFGNPRLQPMVTMLQNSIRRETRLWRPESSLSLRQIELTEKLTCFVVEPSGKQLSGACLFCHGGGMIFPLQVSSMRIAAYYAQKAQISVWVPDYSLPPEAPFPKPLTECLLVWREMAKTTNKAFLYGESVGGALAASAALALRDAGEISPVMQMLVFPALDCRTADYPSAQLDGEAVWTLRNNQHMWDLYLPDEDTKRLSYALPLRERANDLPPAYIESAEKDILRDEAEAYALKLRFAGVPVENVRIPGAWHGFDTEMDHPLIRQILDLRVEQMRKALSRKDQEVKRE